MVANNTGMNNSMSKLNSQLKQNSLTKFSMKDLILTFIMGIMFHLYVKPSQVIIYAKFTCDINCLSLGNKKNAHG